MDMKNEAINEYLVKDLGEASALLAKSAKLLRLQKENAFFWFVFSNKQLCEEIAEKYWFGELLINAKSYYESMRTLKDRLFMNKPNRI
jgi:hypothetical protein